VLVFLKQVLMNYFPKLASNHDSPDCCLLSSKDYRHEPQVPSLGYLFLSSYTPWCANLSL
jgi:hypothetical protein